MNMKGGLTESWQAFLNLQAQITHFGLTPLEEAMAMVSHINENNNMNLQVKHDVSPENEIAINPVWCDIGSHKVSETLIRSVADVAVCEDCYDHYTDSWK